MTMRTSPDPAAATAGADCSLAASASSVSVLMRQAPKQLELSTLAALCVAPDYQPAELIEVDTTAVTKPASRAKPAANLHARERCSPC
jgi:hypothetical protein